MVVKGKNEQKDNEEQRPIRRAVIAEAGRQLLDRLSISHVKTESKEKSKKVKQPKPSKKRNLSERSLKVNDQANPAKLQKLKVDPDQARKPGVIPKMWTPEEDLLLQEAINKHGERNWRAIAELVPGRSYIQCLQRWKKALRPGLKKGHWTKEEDAHLLKLVEKYRPDWDWGVICKNIPGRNAKQCRERWFLNLDPNINRGPWTPEEDEQLLNYVAQLGGRWALIAKHMEGRTENSVKTRFHSLQRKDARNRKWTKEEDDQIVAAVLKYGREFDKIDGMIKGRTKGQIKKRFSILSQQQPDLIRNVYAVEDRIRQQKAAEAGANGVAQGFPVGSALPQFNRAPAPFTRSHSLQSDSGVFPPSAWLTGMMENIAEANNASTLQKTVSTRVIEDILKPNQNVDIDSSESKVNRDGMDLPSTLQHYASSGLTRLLTSGSTLQGLSSGLGGSFSMSPDVSQQLSNSRTSPKMEMLDKLLGETNQGAPNKLPQSPAFPQYPPTAPFMYNPSVGMSQESLLSRTSFGMDTMNMPYDANAVMYNPNNVPKRPVQRASSSLGSLGLLTYDSDMKNLLNSL